MVYVVCEGCTLTYIKVQFTELHCHIGPPAIDNTHQSWKEPTTVCCDDSTPTPLFQVTTCHYHWTYFPNCLDMNDNSTWQWLHLCYFKYWWCGDFKGNNSNARGGISNRDLLGVCCFSNNKLTHKSFKIILIIFCAVLADAAGWQDPGLHPESPIKVTYVPTCCFAASTKQYQNTTQDITCAIDQMYHIRVPYT